MKAWLNIGIILRIMIFMALGSACSKAPDTSTVVKPKGVPAFQPSSIDSADEGENASDQPAYPIIAALPEQICSDVTYRDATGVLKIGRRACAGVTACTMNGEKNCVANADFPAVDLTGALASNLAKIHHSLTIFELEGTLPDCASMGETSCYTAPGTAAVNPSSIDSSKILSGYTLLGVSGTLPTCSLVTTQNCLVPVGRKAATKCADGGSNCFVAPYSLGVEPLKAFDVSLIAASDIKAGVTIGGVLGTYPSAGVPLAGSADGNVDLLSTTFTAQLQTASTFGWFDRNGLRHTASGDADFVSSNIMSGTTIFGVTGDAVVPDSWDVRGGSPVGLATGRMKMNCQSGYDLNTFDIGLPKRVTVLNDVSNTLTIPSHGFQNDDEVRLGYSTSPAQLAMSTTYYVIALDGNNIQLAAGAGGLAIDFAAGGTNFTVFRWQDGAKSYFDSIDFANNDGALVSSASGSEEASFCGGVYPTDSYGIWEDVTVGTCNTLSDDCVFRDRITKLEWSEALVSSHFSYAHSRCAGLDFNGRTDWRLPTQKEALEASNHNMRSVNNDLWIDTDLFDNPFWTSTASDSTLTHAVYLGYSLSGQAMRKTLLPVTCVRGGM